MSGANWYPHYPRDFLDGVQGMGADTIGAYIVVLDLIYARGGAVPRDERYLAGLIGCSIRLVRSLLDRLIDAGKLAEIDGKLTNVRAEKEVETQAKRVRKLSEAGANGGRKRAENAAAFNENSDIAQASLKPGSSIRQDRTGYIEREAKASPKKGHRLPSDWQPADLTPAGKESADTLGPERVARELERFRDYWASVPGQKGVKTDWDATWRNWLSNAVDRLPKPNAKPAAIKGREWVSW